MNYYDIATGRFVPRNPKDGKFYTIGKSDDAMYLDIINGSHKQICINDTKNLDFEKEKIGLISAFDKKFPTKSAFEK